LIALAVVAIRSSAAGAQVVVPPTPRLDSTQARVRDALYLMRDSLVPVGAATARVPLDLERTSEALLRSRARVLADRCERARRVVPATVHVVRDYTPPTRQGRTRREQLLATLRNLDADLGSCSADFTDLLRPERAGDLRGYAVTRSQKVQVGVDRYEASLRDYFPVVLGIQYLPNLRGAGRIPGS
jgi:hypothetical protein